jgi:FHA domain
LHLVGRAPRCSLALTDSRVSSEHASLRWDGEHWSVRDLGSLNKTLVDGRAIGPSEAVQLVQGSRIAFGTDDEVWILEEAGGPCVMAVPVAGGTAVLEQKGLIALPSVDDPRLTLFRSEDGSWAVEDQSTTAPLLDQAIIQAGEVSYRFCLPQVASRTTPVTGLQGCRVSDLGVNFLVSSDLEHIEVMVTAGMNQQRLPARSHNELLLLLARQRRQDEQQGLPPPNCGWVHQDQVGRMVRLDPEHLNVQIFRIRRQFAELGLVDPGQIVERRPRNRQMRFGVARSAEMTV